MSALEKAAREAWRVWGFDWMKWTTCSGCGQHVVCRARRKSGPWLCLDCFDQR